MKISYEKAREISASYASVAIQNLYAFTRELPHNDTEKALPSFPADALETLYRRSMMRSLHKLVTVELPDTEVHP